MRQLILAATIAAFSVTTASAQQDIKTDANGNVLSTQIKRSDRLPRGNYSMHATTGMQQQPVMIMRPWDFGPGHPFYSPNPDMGGGGGN